MIEKKTVVDQIEITRNGTIQVRFGLLLVENGIELSCAYHRTAVDPGGDISSQLAAVNAHLLAMGKAEIPADQSKRVTDIAPLVHTEEVVLKFRETQRPVTVET